MLVEYRAHPHVSCCRPSTFTIPHCLFMKIRNLCSCPIYYEIYLSICPVSHLVFFLWMSQQYEFIHTSKCSIFHFKLVHQRSSPISITLLTKLVAASFFCLDVYVPPGGSFSGLLVKMSIQQQLLYSNLAVYGELHKQTRLVR